MMLKLRQVAAVFERATGGVLPIEWGARPERAREIRSFVYNTIYKGVYFNEISNLFKQSHIRGHRGYGQRRKHHASTYDKSACRGVNRQLQQVYC